MLEHDIKFGSKAWGALIVSSIISGLASGIGSAAVQKFFTDLDEENTTLSKKLDLVIDYVVQIMNYLRYVPDIIPYRVARNDFKVKSGVLYQQYEQYLNSESDEGLLYPLVTIANEAMELAKIIGCVAIDTYPVVVTLGTSVFVELAQLAGGRGNLKQAKSHYQNAFNLLKRGLNQMEIMKDELKEFSDKRYNKVRVSGGWKISTDGVIPAGDPFESEAIADKALASIKRLNIRNRLEEIEYDKIFKELSDYKDKIETEHLKTNHHVKLSNKLFGASAHKLRENQQSDDYDPGAMTPNPALINSKL